MQASALEGLGNVISGSLEVIWMLKCINGEPHAMIINDMYAFETYLTYS